MTTGDLTSVKPAAVVDCRGSACPGPLMEAKKVGHECLGSIPGDGYDRIFITRKK